MEKYDSRGLPITTDSFYFMSADVTFITLSAATSMRWIEVKMRELGVTTNENYNVAFFMDHGAMITVHTPAYGVVDASCNAIYCVQFTIL